MNTINLLSDARYFDESNTKLHELRSMLDSKHSKEKLEAMKKLLAMMTLGRDVSAFFPDVVKNVVVESQEVKKLVYMFLITYSENNQDLALLSINSFQKDLASPSQRTRANALKAMSSIRIPIAVPLVMLALKSAIKDNSSYVKRAAACAIPKVFSVDDTGEQKDTLIAMIAELLTSTEPIVLGSALFAYQEVCPHHYHLLHQHFRKICHLLADFDEWGQTVALNTLLRYARTQFLSPFGKDKVQDGSIPTPADPTSAIPLPVPLPVSATQTVTKPKKKKKAESFYSDEDESESSKSAHSDSDADDSSADSDKENTQRKVKTDYTDNDYVMDDDHSLLLRQAESLLHSANSAVIMSVAALHWNLAPADQCAIVVKPLVRLSRNKRSIQYVILTNILTMAKSKPHLFTPYLKDFYVHHGDASFVRELKLELLSYIVNDMTIQSVVKEVSVYCYDADKMFVCQAIQCLGRCAISIPSVADKCMATLLRLVTSHYPAVVAQSVVTIRQLLQTNSSLHSGVVKKMARLLDLVQIPVARTAIVWMVGEYRDHIPQMAPDCLRRLAKSFKEESDIVKQQILNLSVKLFLSNPKQTSSLFKYIMDLCKYDMNYDLRDRARLMRALFFKKKQTEAASAATLSSSANAGNEVKENMKGLFLIPKPPPNLDDPLAVHDRYVLGTLSQALGASVSGYEELPPFPLVAPDSDVRKPIVEAYIQEEEKRREREARGGRSSDESESESGRSSESSASESDFSEFESEDERSGSGSDRSRSDRSGSESRSGSDSGEDSDGRRGRRRAARSKTKKRRGDDGSGSDSRSRSGSGSPSRSDSDKNADSDRGSRSESGSDSDSDSSAAARRRKKEKEKLKEKDKREQEKAEKERQKQTEKEREKAAKEEEKRKKKEDKELRRSGSNKVRDEQKESTGSSGKHTRSSSSPQSHADLLDLNDLEAAPVSSSPPPSSSGKEKTPIDPSLNAFPSSSALPQSSPASHSRQSSSPKSDPFASLPASHSSGSPSFPGLIIPSRGQRGQLLNPVTSGGLRIDYVFSRKESLYGKRMTDLELTLANESTGVFDDISMSEEDKEHEHDSDGLDDVGTGNLGIGEEHNTKIHVNFKGKLQPRSFIISVSGHHYTVKLTPHVGELIRPHLLSLAAYNQAAKRLSGMSEHRLDITVNDANINSIAQRMIDVLHIAVLAERGEDERAEEVLRMSGQSIHDDTPVLLLFQVKQREGRGGKVLFVAHCEDFLWGTSLQDLAKKTLG